MNRLVALFFFQIFFFGNAQEENSLRKALENLLYNRVQDAYRLVDMKSKSEEGKVLKWHIDAFQNGVLDSLYTKPLDSLNGFRTVMELLKEGEIYGENHVGKDSLIFQNYKQALEVIRYSNDRILTKFVLKKLLKFTFGNRESFTLLDNYVSIYSNYIENQDDQAIYDYYKYSSISYQTDSPYIEEYETALLTLKNSKNYLLRGRFNQMLGVQVSYFNKDDELGINYFEEAADMYEKVPGATGERSLFGIYNNLGVAYSRKKKTGIALDYFRKALRQDLPKNSLLEKSYLYLAMAEVYKDIGDLDSTYHYLNKEKETLKAFNEFENALKIQDIETKYQTAEKEKQILEQQQKARITRNWLIAAAIALLLGSGVAVLLQKNTTKKRKLAEQEAMLEQQKVTTLLKEQELTSIDAMIAGQEKERTKVANELHDDLGSLMATVKLHFDNVKVDQKDPALMNAQKLLDEAYQKIRGMAHSKNSGVMANQGLLPAVKKMAETITKTNALEVTVEDFGLGDRMENSLELTIFRIIQELTANIIKHSEANRASIQFTQHENNLNIIVEDNGKGFDMSEVQCATSGMGLGTIEKRIEHLEGSFTVDSILGKGTSILIDIPI